MLGVSILTTSYTPLLSKAPFVPRDMGPRLPYWSIASSGGKTVYLSRL